MCLCIVFLKLYRLQTTAVAIRVSLYVVPHVVVVVLRSSKQLRAVVLLSHKGRGGSFPFVYDFIC